MDQSVLTLATRGILSVHQEAYEDQSTEEYGVRYKYGEIHLCIPGLSEATAAQHWSSVVRPVAAESPVCIEYSFLYYFLLLAVLSRDMHVSFYSINFLIYKCEVQVSITKRLNSWSIKFTVHTMSKTPNLSNTFLNQTFRRLIPLYQHHDHHHVISTRSPSPHHLS